MRTISDGRESVQAGSGQMLHRAGSLFSQLLELPYNRALKRTYRSLFHLPDGKYTRSQHGPWRNPVMRHFYPGDLHLP